MTFLNYSDELFKIPRGGIARAAISYTTSFPATEDPISEGGVWLKQTPNIAPGNHAGWHAVKTTAGGNAVATANAGSAPPDYDDSYAYLAGNWSPNQKSEATVYMGAGSNELELLLRVSDTSTEVEAYEVLVNCAGGCAFVRWNGPQDDFTILAENGSGLTDPGGMSNGDRMKARIVGQTITAWYSRAGTPTTWVLIGEYVDNAAAKLTAGAPGIGFFARESASIDYGFSDFTAREL